MTPPTKTPRRIERSLRSFVDALSTLLFRGAGKENVSCKSWILGSRFWRSCRLS